MSEYRLVMKGVVKTFPGVKALDHAQLELRPGKVMALMGENGAGKSTLMKCMFGIYKMDEGEIEYEGEKVTIPTPSGCTEPRHCHGASGAAAHPGPYRGREHLAGALPHQEAMAPSPWWITPKCTRTPRSCSRS